MSDRSQEDAKWYEDGICYLYLQLRSLPLRTSYLRPEHFAYSDNAAAWARASAGDKLPVWEDLGVSANQQLRWREFFVPTDLVHEYENRVIDAWRERNLLLSMRQAIEALAGDGGVDEAIALARGAIDQAMAGQVTSSESHSSAGKRALQQWAEHLRGNMYPTLPMPIPKIQNATGGWRLGKLYTVAAITSCHKTTFARQSAWHVAKSIQNGHALVWTMEDDNVDIAARTIAQEVRHCTTKTLSTGARPDGVDDYAIAELTGAAVKHIESDHSNRLRYIDRPRPRLSEVLGTLASEAQRGCRFAVLDFLQLILPDNPRHRADDMHWFDVMNSLQALAKQLHIPILVTAQPTSEAERRCEKERVPIVKSDIRGAAAIQQAAYGIFVINPIWARHGQDWERNRSRIHIVMAKNKGGPCPEDVFSVVPAKDTILDSE